MHEDNFNIFRKNSYESNKIEKKEKEKESEIINKLKISSLIR